MPRIPRPNNAGIALLAVAFSGAVFTAAAFAFVETPQQGTTAPGAHEFRLVDNPASCLRCHDGTYPHFLHEGQSCNSCHGGGHVATKATCLDCHGGHDDPVPLALCTVCHEDFGGSLIEEPNDHQSKVDPSQCSLCHGGGGGGFAPSATTTTSIPPSTTIPGSTTIPPSTTIPGSTTIPPSTTIPGSTTIPPSTTTTTAPPGNQAPTADAGSSRAVQVGEFSRYDGSGSSDSDGSIVSYRWNFGDGTSGTGPVLDHSYSQAGTYTVVLIVTDDGGLTAADALIVSVQN